MQGENAVWNATTRSVVDVRSISPREVHDRRRCFMMAQWAIDPRWSATVVVVLVTVLAVAEAVNVSQLWSFPTSKKHLRITRAVEWDCLLWVEHPLHLRSERQHRDTRLVV